MFGSKPVIVIMTQALNQNNRNLEHGFDQQEHYSYINVDSRNCEFWVVNQCVTFCLM